jgi:hypothetical protein
MCSAHQKIIHHLYRYWQLFSLTVLLSAAFASESPRASNAEIIKSVQTALAEAETLGLPSLAGATLFEGDLALPNVSRERIKQLHNSRHIHAQLPDGSWLIDLVYPLPAKMLSPKKIAALKPFTLDAVTSLATYRSHEFGTSLDLLTEARRCALGVPGATNFSSLRRLKSGELNFYPRADWSSDAGDMVRLACRDYFLHLGRNDAAFAITPERWRAATKRIIERKSVPDELIEGPSAQLAIFHKPSVDEMVQGQAQLLPDISDATLVSLAGDRSPALACATVGEVALFILSERWGFDPALLAGRDNRAPLDDAEHDAIAAGLTAWWQRTDHISSPERWLEGLTKMPINLAFNALEQRYHAFLYRKKTGVSIVRYNGRVEDTPEEVPDSKSLVLLRDYLNFLIARWEMTTAMPQELDPFLWNNLVGYCNTISFKDWVSLQTKDDTAHRTLFTERLDACVLRWPRTGRLAHELMLWDDERGRHEELNSHVEALLANRQATKNDALKILLGWVKNGTAQRWQRLATLLEGDVHNSCWQALVELAINPNYAHVRESPTSLQPLIVWWLLRDQRPLPAGVLMGQEAINLEVTKALIHEDSFVRFETKPEMKGNETEEMLKLRIIYRPRVSTICEKLSLEVPDDCVGIPTESRTYSVSQLPELTNEEAKEIRTIISQAVSLGFPDLTGAQATGGKFPHDKINWEGIHIRLSDGTWLANCVHPVPKFKLTDEPQWLNPDIHHRYRMHYKLPSNVKDRIGSALYFGD